MQEPTDAVVDQVAERLRNARHLVVLTGAGISVESGLRTFRDPAGGLWAEHDPEEICTPQAFARDPRLVWEWHEWQRKQVEGARPNPAHLALAEMEHRLPRVTIVTQNFDGLHQEAGSTRVLELHGNVRRFKCYREGDRVEDWPLTMEVPPRCPRCGGPLRHDVVWFGEPLPPGIWEDAMDASASCDLFFSIGTSGIVQPAASLPDVALLAGATALFVNLEVETTAQSPFYGLNGPAGDILPALVRRAWPDALPDARPAD